MKIAKDYLEEEIKKPYLSGLKTDYVIEIDKDQLIHLLDGLVKKLNIPLVIDSYIQDKNVEYKGIGYTVYNTMIVLAPDEDGDFVTVPYQKLRK